MSKISRTKNISTKISIMKTMIVSNSTLCCYMLSNYTRYSDVTLSTRILYVVYKVVFVVPYVVVCMVAFVVE